MDVDADSIKMKVREAHAWRRESGEEKVESRVEVMRTRWVKVSKLAKMSRFVARELKGES